MSERLLPSRAADGAPPDPAAVVGTQPTRPAAGAGGTEPALPSGRRARIGAQLTSRPWMGPLLAAAVAAAAGLLLGLTMPRGPVTGPQALVGIAAVVPVGFAAGAAMRSRWAMLLAPVAFVVAVEFARLPVPGPLVDAPDPSVLGLVALVLGRGFDAVLLLFPMVLAASFGAAAARRWWPAAVDGEPSSRGWTAVRRVVTGLLTVGLVALVAGVARPARTAPIEGPDGQPLAGSIAELTTVELGGHEQGMMIRGVRDDAPVLLWLAGGPGGSDIGAMRLAGRRLEEAFVVVTWDQRGAGTSYRALDPADTLTVEQAVADTLQLTEHLRERFGQDRIYLAGNSWGTLPGVLAVQQRPEWFHAYVGAGQMVDIRATDQLFYDDTLAYARAQGDPALEATLVALGPPPYEDFLDYDAGVFGGEQRWNAYERVPGSAANSEMPGTLRVPEYDLVTKVRTGAATLDTLGVLYPKLQEVDLRTAAPRLEVPVVLVQGRHEARGRAELADAWFAQLEAPSKQLVVFERSGHRPMFEEPDRFFEVMTEQVLAADVPA
jgi:proline iminopeptidase